jgi:hypothetical protein
MWVGLGLKPSYFIYLVKPKSESELNPTYLLMISSQQKPKPDVWSPSPQKSGPTHLQVGVKSFKMKRKKSCKIIDPW